MLFNSTIFILAFLPITVGAYYLCAGRPTGRRLVLALASTLFYAWWDWRFIPLLAGSVTANWLLVEGMHRTHRRGLLTAAVVLNLGLIGIFKYADFFADSFAFLAGGTHGSFDILLPLGISFFTFQQISYVVDVRRGTKARYSFLDYYLFVTFFPQLIAGPIVRHDEIIGQFAADPRRPGMWERLTRGAALFLIGVAKKVAIADQAAKIADPLFDAVLEGGGLLAADAWAAVGAYTLQIYFDFSGYSDMAIGLGLLCGFLLPFNFNAPYRSLSIQDFWRRWHMTLSRFLRDYLYIPLGGNRRGPRRQALNVSLTMLLGGLWHGAAWTFIAWGGWHGLGLAAQGAWARLGRSLPRPLAWAITLLFVMVGWVLFRAADFPAASRMIASMFGAYGWGGRFPALWLVLPVGAVVALVGPTSQEAALVRLAPRRRLGLALGVACLLLLLLIGGELKNEFIYFQF